MKKTFALLAVFAIALCASCSKDQEIETEDKIVPGEEQTGEGVTQFTASIPETKTYLGEPEGDVGSRTWPNLWSEGDAVNVNGVNSIGLTEETGANTSDAIFNMETPVSGPNYYAVSPASAVTSYDGSKYQHTVSISETQSFVADSYDPAAYLMAVKNTTPSLNFSPLMGLIQLKTTGPATGTLYIKSISVESVGDETMTGSFTTNADHTAITGGSGKQITISAPAGTTKPFGTVFTFAVPAQNYASGIRFRITATTDDEGTEGEQTMVFAKQSAFNVTVGTLYPLTAPAFKASNITTLACTFKTSSSAGFEWSAANASNNVKKVWRLAIYSNSACTDSYLVVQHDIPADATANGLWKGQSGTPRFIVGGLAQGTNYWCKVTDLANGVSKVVEFTTDAFTPVSASSPSGSTLVAEDFSEIGWGSAFLGGYAEHRYAGWAPVNAASAQNKISFAAPTGIVSNGYYNNYEFGVNNVNTNLDYSTVTRLRDGWGWCWEGGFNGYPQPGFLRMGGKNANRSFVVIPALSITEGKYATVAVTVKISHMNSGDASGNPDFGVFKETNLTLSDATRREYTGAVLQHAYPLTSSVYGYDKDELTFTVNGVKNTDHLVLGLYKNVNEENRYNLFSVTVQRVGSEYNDEIFDITDVASLALFNSRVAGGATSLKGNVINNVDASTIASTWTPIAGYTGTLEGNSKTISGLTKPFFADLQGTVRYLTVNSTINDEADAYGEGPAIFAQSLSDGGSLDHCTSQGSVRYCPSSAVADATRYAAGLVAYVTDGSVTNCSNEASVSFPHNSQTNDMNVSIGGVIANIDSASGSCSNSSNSGNVSVGIINGTTTARWMSVGGVVGNIEGTSGTTISNLTNSGEVSLSGTSSGRIYYGGVVGFGCRTTTGCSNTNTVTYTGASGSELYIGGVIGFNNWDSSTETTISNTSNSGAILINSSTQTGQDVYIGGVVAKSSGQTTATNSSTITISRISCKDLRIGGLVGHATKGGIGNGSANQSTGDIAVSNLTGTGVAYIGGIVGHCWSTGSIRATNSGDVILNSSSTVGDDMYIGGIVGYTTRPVRYCTNNGVVTNSIPMTNSANSLGIGGIAGFNSEGGVVQYNHNTAQISNTANSDGPICVGGIVAQNIGYMDDNDNTGNISNSGNTSNGNSIYVGGVTGKSEYRSSSYIKTSSNGTSSSAGGTISNSGSSDGDICIGGLSGYIDRRPLTSCYNKGAVSNTSTATAAGALCIGGLVGKSDAGTYVTCYNTGAVSNSGSASNGGEGVAVDMMLGGLVGYLCGNNTLISTSDAYNYNSGTITDTSNNQWSGIGGIAGYNDGSGTDLSYVRNLETGDLSVSGNTRHKIRIGGILGVTATTLTIDYANNAGDLNFENLTIQESVFIGGILGCFYESTVKETSCTITGCVNSGDINCPDSGDNGGNMAAYNSGVTGLSYIGGITGNGECTNKTLLNCENTGDIIIYNQLPTRLGGIMGYSNKCPTGSVVNVNQIRYRRYNPQGNGVKGTVGGICGYLNIATFTNLTFTGGLSTNSSSPNCYTGGLIGRTKTAGTFTNCKVGKNGKDIVGASSGKFAPTADNGAGLFVSCDSGISSFSFPGSYVATGTKCQGKTITASNLESALIGRNQPTTLSDLPTIGNW